MEHLDNYRGLTDQQYEAQKAAHEQALGQRAVSLERAVSLGCELARLERLIDFGQVKADDNVAG